MIARESLFQTSILQTVGWANRGSLLFWIRRLLQTSLSRPADRSTAGVMLVVLAALFTSFIPLAAHAQPPPAALEQPTEGPAEATPAAAAVPGVTEEEIRQITDETLRVAATCTYRDRDTLRRCADGTGKIKVECYPSNRFFRFWLALVGKEERLEEEGEPTMIIQNQIAELQRQKLGKGREKSEGFPECRSSR